MTFVLGAVLGVFVGTRWQRRKDMAYEIPSRKWRGESITPVGAGPRNKAPERVARGPILTQAVVLAVEMARADGQVDGTETEAIRAFILNNVTSADSRFAEMVVSAGLECTRQETTIEAAIDTIRAFGSSEQQMLIVELLVSVAQADGLIHPGEKEFIARVGVGLGIDESIVVGLLEPPS